MERLVDVSISYTEKIDSILSFKIVYPGQNSDKSPDITLKNYEDRIKDLENQIKEKDLKILESIIMIAELNDKFSCLAFEVEEKNIEIETLQEAISSQNIQIESLQNMVSELNQFKESKVNQCVKLQKTLNDIKANRKTAEVLLEKQEIMNKELIEKNAKFEKALHDTEKKNLECSKIIQKLKDEINSTAENHKQRDEQIKSILRKIKILESEKVKFIEEIRKKDEIIKKIHSNPKELHEIQVDRTKDSKDTKKMIEILNMKDNEIKMMKDMIKSFQSRPQKSQNPQIQKSIKLPPISGETSKKTSKISVQLKENNQSSFNSLERVESFASSRVRKPTPLNPRRNFKSLFTENEETSINSQNLSSEQQSPKFENLKGQNELKKNPSDRKVNSKVMKNGEIFKDVQKRKIDFNEEIDDKFLNMGNVNSSPKARKRVSFKQDFENTKDEDEGKYRNKGRGNDRKGNGGDYNDEEIRFKDGLDDDFDDNYKKSWNSEKRESIEMIYEKENNQEFDRIENEYKTNSDYEDDFDNGGQDFQDESYNFE